MHSQCLNQQKDIASRGQGTVTGDLCGVTAQLPHDTMEGGTVVTSARPLCSDNWLGIWVINVIETQCHNKVSVGSNTKPMQIRVYLDTVNGTIRCGMPGGDGIDR